MPSNITKYVCVCCERSYPPTDELRTCPSCGPDDGVLDIRYDLTAVAEAWRAEPLANRQTNQWRYRELLPLPPEAIPNYWSVGWTPVLDLPALARDLGVAQLWLKDEGRNPTASLKDRASSVGVADARRRAAGVIATASTGNAATSLAGHAALAGMDCVIFVPRNAAAPKLAQLLVYGATVFSVSGPYDEAYQLCTEACDEFGWYNRNCAINPVLVEGKKTCGLEIAEQMASSDAAPDWVAVSVGDGCTIAGVWKGLAEMHALGVIERLPRLLGVQAEGVAPIAYAIEHGSLPASTRGATIADGINVDTPRNWRKAVQAIEASSGSMVTVSDDDILTAIAQSGRRGAFGEPAAAAAVAGVKTAVRTGVVKASDRVLGILTGSGLKDTASAMKAIGSEMQAIEINADLKAVAAAMSKRGTHE